MAPPKKDTTRHYCDNKKLLRLVIEHQEKSAANPDHQMSNDLGRVIISICEGLGQKHNWRGYTFRDEFVMNGILEVVKAVKFFDVSKSKNPFAYFTMVAWRSFIRTLDLEQRANYIKHKNARRLALGGLEGGEDGGENDLGDQVIAKFEDKLERRREKAKVSNANRDKLKERDVNKSKSKGGRPKKAA
jgi:hypothetical protein